QNQRRLVQRAAAGHAEPQQPGPAQVLDRGQQSRLDHFDDRITHNAGSAVTARSPASIASYSSRVTGANRTVSPGWIMNGSGRFTSNMVSGVRPIMFQPPGNTSG